MVNGEVLIFQGGVIGGRGEVIGVASVHASNL
jgi:hypothetical protein